MKKATLMGLAGAALLCACQPAQRPGTVSGTLTDIGNDTLLATSIPMDGSKDKERVKDTLVLQEGKFMFQAPCDTVPYQIILHTPQDKLNYLELVLLPGESLTVSGTTSDYRVEGSPFNTALQQILDTLRPYERKVYALSDTMFRLEKEQGKKAKEKVRKIYTESYRPALEQMMDVRRNYVKRHPDNDVSLYLLSMMGLGNIRELLPTLADEVKNGPLAPLYRTFENSIKVADKREAAQKRIKKGIEAPDFTLKNLQDQPFTLSTLRGKYVVLDFWGSWCGSCIADIPKMKEYYKKYKDKLEILGIDCRDTEEKWKAAVEKHKIPWLHVRNEDNPDVSLLYGIQAYPTKIVIDPAGKIAKIVLGEGPAFYEYLDKLFN